MTRSCLLIALLLFANLIRPPVAKAALDPVVLQSSTGPLINFVGLLGAHRAFQPARNLKKKIGLDFGLEISFVRVPPSFNDALTAAGQASSLVSAPAAKIVGQKSLGDSFLVALGWLRFLDFNFWSGMVQFTLSEPPPDEEGLTYALRLGYSISSFMFINAKNWQPQLVISKRLGSFDVYWGGGAQLISGDVQYDTGVIGILSFPGSSSNWFLNLGCEIDFGPSGIKMFLDGSYNSSGGHTLGTKFAFEM